MAQSLLLAIKLMHDRKLVHQDIKPENILVYQNKDGDYYLSLTDFGLTADQDRKIQSLATAGYESPEIYIGHTAGWYQKGIQTQYNYYNGTQYSYSKKLVETHQLLDNELNYESIQQYLTPDPKNDMWAAGIVLHQLYYGKVPINEESYQEDPLLKGLLAIDRNERLTADKALEVHQLKGPDAPVPSVTSVPPVTSAPPVPPVTSAPSVPPVTSAPPVASVPPVSSVVNPEKVGKAKIKKNIKTDTDIPIKSRSITFKELTAMDANNETNPLLNDPGNSIDHLRKFLETAGNMAECKIRTFDAKENSIKITMENNQQVYIHETPNKGLTFSANNNLPDDDIINICKLAVLSANPNAEFNLLNTPEDNKEKACNALQKAIDALPAGKFNEHERPRVIRDRPKSCP